VPKAVTIMKIGHVAAGCWYFPMLQKTPHELPQIREATGSGIQKTKLGCTVRGIDIIDRGLPKSFENLVFLKVNEDLV